MTFHREEARLLALLQSNSELTERGVSFLPGLESGVVIHYGGHSCGVWHAQGDGYEWTPVSHDRPRYRAVSAEDAVAFITRMLFAN